VDWVPDGSQLVSGSGFAAGRFGEQLELKLWSPSTGECLNTLKVHRAEINGVRFSPDGTMIASCSGSFFLSDTNIRLWDVGTGRELKEFLGRHLATMPWGKAAPINGVSLSSEGTMLASCGGGRCSTFGGGSVAMFDGVRMWDVGTGRELSPLISPRDYILTVDWSFDGKVLASGGAAGIILWDAKKSERLTELKGHSGDVNAVAWSIDGLLAISSLDGTVKIWNPSAGECLTLEGHNKCISCLQFNPTDAGQLVTGSRDDKTVTLWNVKTIIGHEAGSQFDWATPHGRKTPWSASGRGRRTGRGRGRGSEIGREGK
jgi:WD40 repeat protein